MKVTLAQVREQARRVYGADCLSSGDGCTCLGGPAYVVHVRGGHIVRFEARSKQAARKFALRTLRDLPSAGAEDAP